MVQLANEGFTALPTSPRRNKKKQVGTVMEYTWRGELHTHHYWFAERLAGSVLG